MHASHDDDDDDDDDDDVGDDERKVRARVRLIVCLFVRLCTLAIGGVSHLAFGHRMDDG